MNKFLDFDFENDTEKNVECIIDELSKDIEDKTDGILTLESKTSNFKKDFSTYEYDMYISIYIIAPKLDNYKYSLFVVYTNLDENFPIGFLPIMNDIGKMLEYDINEDYEKYGDYDEFEKNIKEFINSTEVKNVLKNLYRKST